MGCITSKEKQKKYPTDSEDVKINKEKSILDHIKHESEYVLTQAQAA